MKHNSVAELMPHPATPCRRELHRRSHVHRGATTIRRTLSAIFIALSLVFALAAFGVPLGTSFTYQGQLRRSGAAYTGTCNFQFSLWDAVSAGTQQGSTQAINSVSVTNGLFTVVLDFGSLFKGDARWLGTSVQCSGDGGFTPLDPRQPLTAAPYALSLRPGASIQGEVAGFYALYVANLAEEVGFAGGLGANGDSVGVSGESSFGDGLYGKGRNGVHGVSGNGTGAAIWGESGTSFASTGPAIWGQSANTGPAIFGQALSTGLAGRFIGPVSVEGNLFVNGGVFKSSGNFRIDHPLDPANKFLSHSFVESPDMMNIYNGNVTTDATGSAIVTLPDYFSALNRDFRYQLTVLGQFAQAIVSRKIDGNSFEIRTDKPGVEVSWQVTGIRQDAYAQANPIAVEESKPAEEQGLYLFPAGFGAGEEKQIGYPSRPATAPGAQEPPATGPGDQARSK
jgi:hypothetical protein